VPTLDPEHPVANETLGHGRIAWVGEPLAAKHRSRQWGSEEIVVPQGPMPGGGDKGDEELWEKTDADEAREPRTQNDETRHDGIDREEDRDDSRSLEPGGDHGLLP